MGFVDSQSQVAYVDKLVRNVEGVHTIHSELSIKE
jgi:osmotically-inducible protein OsmY